MVFVLYLGDRRIYSWHLNEKTGNTYLVLFQLLCWSQTSLLFITRTLRCVHLFPYSSSVLGNYRVYFLPFVPPSVIVNLKTTSFDLRKLQFSSVICNITGPFVFFLKFTYANLPFSTVNCIFAIFRSWIQLNHLLYYYIVWN